MKKIDPGQAISTIANVGVIVGLVFLVAELNQTNEMVRAQTRASVTQATIDNIALYREPRVMEASMKARRGEPLTEEEEYLLDSAANATFRMWENNFYQYRAGLFDQGEFDAELVMWQRIIDEETEYLVHWRSFREGYSEAFREIVDGIILDLSK